MSGYWKTTMMSALKLTDFYKNFCLLYDLSYD